MSHFRSVLVGPGLVALFLMSVPSAAQPPDAVAHYRAGYTQLQSKDFRNAAIELEAAVGVDSTYFAALYALGKANAQLGEYAKAADALEGAIRHAGVNAAYIPRIEQFLGDLFYKAALRSRQQRRFGEAIERFEASLKYKPGNAQALYTIALCHISLRQADKAIPVLQQAAAADAAYPWPLKSLGDIYRQKGDLAKAASFYQQAIAVDDQLVQAYEGLAQVRIKSDDLAGAVETLKKAVALDAKFTEGHLLIGTCLIKLEQHGQAIAPLKKAVSLDGGNAEARYRLAEAHLGAGNHRDAVSAAGAAVRAQQDFHAAQVILADAHSELGELSEARRWYTSAQSSSRFRDYCAHKLQELDAAQKQAQGQQ